MLISLDIIHSKIGLQIIAFQDPISQAYNYSPNSDDTIQENMTLITLGEPSKITNLEKFIQ